MNVGVTRLFEKSLAKTFDSGSGGKAEKVAKETNFCGTHSQLVTLLDLYMSVERSLIGFPYGDVRAGVGKSISLFVWDALAQ